MIFCALCACFGGTADADPFATKDVLCGATRCGTMEITSYGDAFKDTTSSDPDKWFGGIKIKGTFSPVRALEYHYLQAVLDDKSGAFRWISDKNVPLTAPYIDFPPNGYARIADASGSGIVRFPADVLPWYDGDAVIFPTFTDDPSNFLRLAKKQADNTLPLTFETWLVCVILDEHNDNLDANDDRYRIAPLLGWTWGENIVFKDIGVIGTDEPQDFTVNSTRFSFVTKPSDEWVKALAKVYGTAPRQDFFNIQIGDCTDCKAPEPATVILLLLGLIVIAAARSRPTRVRGRR
jgi:hypothetical protein